MNTINTDDPFHRATFLFALVLIVVVYFSIEKKMNKNIAALVSLVVPSVFLFVMWEIIVPIIHWIATGN